MKKRTESRIKIEIVSKMDAPFEIGKILEKLDLLVRRIFVCAPELMLEQRVMAPGSEISGTEPFTEEMWRGVIEYMSDGTRDISIADDDAITKEKWGHLPDFYLLAYFVSRDFIPLCVRPEYRSLNIMMQESLYRQLDAAWVGQWAMDMAVAMRAVTGYIDKVRRVNRGYHLAGQYAISKMAYNARTINKLMDRQLAGAFWRQLYTKGHISQMGGLESLLESVPFNTAEEVTIDDSQAVWLQLTDDIDNATDEERLRLREAIGPLLPEIDILSAAKDLRVYHGALSDNVVYSPEEQLQIKYYNRYSVKELRDIQNDE